MKRDVFQALRLVEFKLYTSAVYKIPFGLLLQWNHDYRVYPSHKITQQSKHRNDPLFKHNGVVTTSF